MKVRYCFKIHGRVRPDRTFSIPVDGWEVNFDTANGFLSHVLVDVPLPDRNDWPSVQERPTPGVRLEVNPKLAHLPAVQRYLRTLQGLLAMYGVTSFDLEGPQVEWLPETDQERDDLQLHNFSLASEKLPDDEIEPVPFEFIACSALATAAASNLDAALNFFRRGTFDLNNRDYIDAIYDFYFTIETLYADGKFRKNAVLAAFRNSQELCDCVQEALDDPGLMLNHYPKVRAEFDQKYGSMSVDQVLEEFFDLRGKLHHHAPKQPDSWHPDEPRRFECDALFLQKVAFGVVFKVSWPLLQQAQQTSLQGSSDAD